MSPLDSVGRVKYSANTFQKVKWTMKRLSQGEANHLAIGLELDPAFVGHHLRRWAARSGLKTDAEIAKALGTLPHKLDRMRREPAFYEPAGASDFASRYGIPWEAACALVAPEKLPADVWNFAKVWEDFRVKVLHSVNNWEQLHDMRVAFYAGAWAMVCTMDFVSDKYSEEEVGKHFAELYRQLETFNSSTVAIEC